MKSILAIAAFMFSASAFAAGTRVCTEVPEFIKADSITTNFDGSVSYVNPMVYADGQFMRVHAYAGIRDAQGFCTSLSKKYSGSNFEQSATAQVVADIREDGSYMGSTESTYFYTSIICK